MLDGYASYAFARFTFVLLVLCGFIPGRYRAIQAKESKMMADPALATIWRLKSTRLCSSSAIMVIRAAKLVACMVGLFLLMRVATAINKLEITSRAIKVVPIRPYSLINCK